MRGMWTQANLGHVRDLGEGLCEWCGLQRETLTHKWWECPKFQHIREQFWPEGCPDHYALPVTL
eukprot:3901660-Alexandrium_andersonii.AAC.1